MKRALVILFLLLSVVASATNYYVKNGGSDLLSGTSDANAWETIAKVNAASLVAGDTVFFKCGSTWRITSGSGYLDIDKGTAAGDVVYTSYSTGAKPLILGSKEENEDSDWELQSGNLWANFDITFSTEVGNIIFNSEASAGVRVFTLGNVNSQGKWYYDPALDVLYLYSTSNPGTYYSDIECALKIYPGIIYLDGTDEYVTIDGFDLRYGGRHGVIASTGTNDITVRNCHIGWMGGDISSGTTREGNGIEFYGSCANILIENNHVEQILDCGISSQYWGYSMTISNYVVQNNIIDKADNAFEFFYAGTSGSISNIYYDNNTCINSGKGWSHAQKTGNLAGYDFYVSTLDVTTSNIYIRNNIFSGALLYAIRGTTTPQNLIATAIVWDYNLFNAPVVAHCGSTNYTTLAQWRTYSGDDAHSISDNPDFTSATDFHLVVGSPAIDAGLGIGVNYDYDANLRDANPDIGALEYDGGVPPPPPPILPTVTTTKPFVNLKTLTAAGGGNVTSDGEGTVSVKGVCWSISVNPTTADSKTTDGTGTGAFSSTITGLAAKTTYHVRGYATNEVGTAYGSDVTFKTAPYIHVHHGGKQVYHDGKLVIIQ